MNDEASTTETWKAKLCETELCETTTGENETGETENCDYEQLMKKIRTT